MERIDLPVNDIVNKYKNGKSIRDLAKEYYVDPCTISKRLKEKKVEIRKINSIKDLDYNVVKSMIDQKYTCLEIGQKLGYSDQSIRNFCRLNNIKLRKGKRR